MGWACVYSLLRGFIEAMEQDIHQRLLQLKDVALGHCRSVSVNSVLSNANYDCGIDALLALYAECSVSTSLAKDKNVAKFLHNCKCKMWM